MNQFEKPEMFAQRIETLKEQLPSILDDFPNLKAYHARIKSLPSIASYIKSSKFIAWPLNAPWAYFGGDQ